eukprot:TRINITY_DN28813_c0_g1_i1.p4 TRINITY_DN28813_c0_g1~~TRINITY_DN28813_c0_g1_i1.p4  ORF type:complete len:100 (-),score=3.84 TRINITY_DN28813_c0_g1_i1:245-544(-)
MFLCCNVGQQIPQHAGEAAGVTVPVPQDKGHSSEIIKILSRLVHPEKDSEMQADVRVSQSVLLNFLHKYIQLPKVVQWEEYFFAVRLFFVLCFFFRLLC